eukprot:TRINITY_DN70702_c0_g1_i1.p2 TRINITY_DN70702_c0_g1~~TRINITY_DN70702_c0_g1_i1.p2  ORF type:complete len:294 (+),score=69.64 TRINITY_DN70702_c0_g1_i1:52-882(+)
MAFKFNFNAPSANATSLSVAHPPSTDPPSSPAPPPYEAPAREVLPHHSQHSRAEAPFEALQLADLRVYKSTAAPPPQLAPSCADIVPAVYEGGYKLWECAIDLALYLHQHPLCRHKAVLELGAGHAVPAIVAALQHARMLCIHDYNQPVLHHVTIPNVRANVSRADVRYFCGGWRTLPPLLPCRFDVILSADTVYARAQCDALADCICRCLHPRGVALVAAKTYYFGVGGGTAAFRQALQCAMSKHAVQLQVDVVREIRDGQSNVREIVRIQHQLS